jgi:branched-chain amino acid transport system permease protein
MNVSAILQFILSGITIGSIYAMVALGFNIIYSATDIINFAQGEFVMLGGMVMVSLVKVLNLPMWLAFPIAVLSVTLIGALFERLCIHPLKKPTVLTLIIITIAGSILMKGGAMFVWGKETANLPHFSSEKPILFFGATILPQVL